MYCWEHIAGDLVRPVVSTEQVAESLHDALDDKEFEGVVTVEQIQSKNNCDISCIDYSKYYIYLVFELFQFRF